MAQPSPQRQSTPNRTTPTHNHRSTPRNSPATPSGGSSSTGTTDPMELLLRQELERELNNAWRAYESLVQTAWDSDPHKDPLAQAVLERPSHRRSAEQRLAYERRRGQEAKEPIVLDNA